MKTKLFATAAVVAILTATGAAHAETADIAALKAQSAALKKQNAALEARLNKLEKQEAAKAKTLAEAPAGQPAATSFMAADLSGIKGPLPIPQCALPPLDGPLTFCGITLFGTVDAGLGYASSGLPEGGKIYVGDQLVNKYAHSSYLGVSPSNLSATTLGVKGSTEILPGWSAVFWASTNINPQSGQLFDAPGSVAANNGLNRNNYSNFGDGSRGGQAFNDQLFVGVASKEFGQLTFGRHRSLSNDFTGGYDPTGGAFAFSAIGYSGTPVAGLGNTANARWDDSFKYRVEFPALFVNGLTTRFGAMYKFADGNGGSNIGNAGGAPTAASTLTGTHNYSTQNDAAQFSLGGSYGGLDVDGVIGYFHQSVSTGTPLSSAQLGGTDTFVSNMNKSTITTGNANSNTLAAGYVADLTGGAIGAKYTWNQFKFFAGWSHAIYHNPENNVGLGAQNDQGGYNLSSVTNYAFYHAKLFDTEWAGVKYAYDPKTDITVAYYHEGQNSYGNAAALATCGLPVYVKNINGATINGTRFAYQAAPRSATCSGSLNAASAYIDYHFTKRFDVYGGFMYSVVDGGLASGYYNVNNFAPTVGARFTF